MEDGLVGCGLIVEGLSAAVSKRCGDRERMLSRYVSCAGQGRTRADEVGRVIGFLGSITPGRFGGRTNPGLWGATTLR
jgi:hypothetical protein